jgi:hypothetical protein
MGVGHQIAKILAGCVTFSDLDLLKNEFQVMAVNVDHFDIPCVRSDECPAETRRAY